jgi:hypothetical protein
MSDIEKSKQSSEEDSDNNSSTNSENESNESSEDTEEDEEEPNDTEEEPNDTEEEPDDESSAEEEEVSKSEIKTTANKEVIWSDITKRDNNETLSFYKTRLLITELIGNSDTNELAEEQVIILSRLITNTYWYNVKYSDKINSMIERCIESIPTLKQYFSDKE